MLFQRAFAKINIGLRILRKRDDGYHDLETVFHRVDIFDDLEVKAAGEIAFVCDIPELETGDNLVLVAARALREKFNVRAGARIRLKKRIPHGAGLGGGSSDAGAALRLLVRLWGLRPGPGELESIALSVGSDVPFFLGDESAYATSRGEKLIPFPLVLPAAVVIVSPAIHIPTRDAFADVVPRNAGLISGQGMQGIQAKQAGNKIRAAAPTPLDLRTLVADNLADPRQMRGVVENDFETPLFRSYPAIRAIRDGLYEGGADFALMTGSGSSVYGLFTDGRAASLAAGRLAAEHRVFVTAPGFLPETGISELHD